MRDLYTGRGRLTDRQGERERENGTERERGEAVGEEERERTRAKRDIKTQQKQNKARFPTYLSSVFIGT